MRLRFGWLDQLLLRCTLVSNADGYITSAFDHGITHRGPIGHAIDVKTTIRVLRNPDRTLLSRARLASVKPIGTEPRLILTLDEASSIKSIALSGKNLSGI